MVPVYFWWSAPTKNPLLVRIERNCILFNQYQQRTLSIYLQVPSSNLSNDSNRWQERVFRIDKFKWTASVGVFFSSTNSLYVSFDHKESKWPQHNYSNRIHYTRTHIYNFLWYKYINNNVWGRTSLAYAHTHKHDNKCSGYAVCTFSCVHAADPLVTERHNYQCFFFLFHVYATLYLSMNKKGKFWQMNPNNRVAEHNSSFLVLIQNILVKFISTQVLLLLLSVSLSLSTVLNLSLLSYFLSYSTCHRSFCSIRSLQFTLRRIVHGSRSAPPLPIRQSSISSNTMFISF